MNITNKKMFVMLILLFSIVQAKAEEKESILKGFYITGGMSHSLNTSSFNTLSDDMGYASHKETGIPTSTFIQRYMQSAKYLGNIGIGYDINPYLSVEFNYKRGLPRTHGPIESHERVDDEENATGDDENYDDYNIHGKNYKNSSNNYVIYFVGKLPLPTSYITPFIKAGLGYSQYNTRVYLFKINQYDDQNQDNSDSVLDTRIKTKMAEFSYHMQVGVNFNLNPHNTLAIYWGADYLSGNPERKMVHRDITVDADKEESIRVKKRADIEQNHRIFDNTIGINYTYYF